MYQSKNEQVLPRFFSLNLVFCPLALGKLVTQEHTGTEEGGRVKDMLRGTDRCCLFCPFPGAYELPAGCFPCRPDGTKKAYVRLTQDHDALDVANKIGII